MKLLYGLKFWSKAWFNIVGRDRNDGSVYLRLIREDQKQIIKYRFFLISDVFCLYDFDFSLELKIENICFSYEHGRTAKQTYS